MSLLKKYYEPQSSSSGMAPFLKSDDIDEKGTVFTITDVREANTQYSDIFVDVKAGREEYVIGMKGDSIILDQIVSVLGDDERKWTGKKILVYLAKGRYLNAADPKASTARNGGNGNGKAKRPTSRSKARRK